MSLTEQLVSYILAAMMSWVPVRTQFERASDGKWLHNEHGYYVQEDQDAARARYESMAKAVVAVAMKESNRPLYTGERGRIKTALQLAGIPSFEGGFQKWVENGSCNTPAFQAYEHQVHPGHEACDGGAAFTDFQIHLYRYIIKDGEMYQGQFLENSPDKETREWYQANKDKTITPQQLLDDPEFAAQIAYYIIRWSTSRFHNLCGYTGENDGHICFARHPLADQRLDRPESYLRAHPFVFVEPVATTSIDKTIQEIIVGNIGRMPPMYPAIRLD